MYCKTKNKMETDCLLNMCCPNFSIAAASGCSHPKVVIINNRNVSDDGDGGPDLWLSRRWWWS
ncbi:hypothetical protein Hanom_Chr00s000004g01608151 [Helianthus anomalus]